MTMRVSRGLGAVLVATCCLWRGTLSGQLIKEFPFPWGPIGIASGPDGNLWVTAMSGGNGGGSIWRIPISGTGGQEFLLPEWCPFQTLGCGPYTILAAPDGNMWASMVYYPFIARISMAGEMTEFFYGGVFNSLTVGPDGNLWGTSSELQPNTITRIGLNGAVLGTFTLPTPGPIFAICTGPDGNLWYTAPGNPDGATIGRMTPTGITAEFPLPPDNGYFRHPHGITPGPDGALWFAEGVGIYDRIGRITVGGSLTEFPVSSSQAIPWSICVGPDGALWFTESAGARIGRMTFDGSVREFPLGTNCGPLGITTGPDGNIWFCEIGCGKLGKIDLGVLAAQAASIPTMPSTGLVILGAALATIGAISVALTR